MKTQEVSSFRSSTPTCCRPGYSRQTGKGLGAGCPIRIEHPSKNDEFAPSHRGSSFYDGETSLSDDLAHGTLVIAAPQWPQIRDGRCGSKARLSSAVEWCPHRPRKLPILLQRNRLWVHALVQLPLKELVPHSRSHGSVATDK